MGRNAITVGDVALDVVLPDDFPVALEQVSLSFSIRTEAELRDVVERLGGIGRFYTGGSTPNLLSLHGAKGAGSPARADINLWLRGEAFEQPKPQPLGVVRRMLDEAKAQEAVDDLREGARAESR